MNKLLLAVLLALPVFTGCDRNKVGAVPPNEFPHISFAASSVTLAVGASTEITANYVNPQNATIAQEQTAWNASEIVSLEVLAPNRARITGVSKGTGNVTVHWHGGIDQISVTVTD